MIGRLFQFRRRLLYWYDQHRRELPWRVIQPGGSAGLPNAYHVLVSELMLQQTQVATVVPYFQRFIGQWPTLADLARAGEQQVLRMWQGLGYYARARHLLATAKIVANDFAGQLPQELDELARLPGIGRYTAGAVASIAFGKRAPILDGNVRRVLCRLDGVEADPRAPDVMAALWRRAEEILPERRIGDFNSALMELGATVCTARRPQCPACPAAGLCEARAAGSQERIPRAAPAKARPVERRWTLCIRRGQQWLIERRPATGRWAGMWQFVTLPAGNVAPTAGLVRSHTGLAVTALQRLGSISHTLTHRQYEFEVFTCAARRGTAQDGQCARRWVLLNELSHYPLPRPHVKIAQLLAVL